MGLIKELDNQLVDKIAAGEVVERPKSVVKELVENSLDAGANRIDIEIEDGGKKLIAVIDNGRGMDEHDAKLCFKRHSTSKIRSAEDLFNISSLGFRGEALASIASVANVSLRTKTNSDDGFNLELENGRVTNQSKWKGKVGSRFIIKNLFAHVPARQNFLKSSPSEFAAISDYIRAVSLQHPSVAFSLSHNGKASLVNPAGASFTGNLEENSVSLRARAAALLGTEEAAKLLLVSGSSQFGELWGLVSPPGYEKTNSKNMYCFVNGRYVNDKVLRYGILRGYHSHLLKGRYPLTILYLKTDPGLIDVNVHPAKTELRFQYPNEVQSLISLAIRKALRQGAWADAEPAVQTTPSSSPELPFRRDASYLRDEVRISRKSFAPSPLAHPAVNDSFTEEPEPKKSERLDWRELSFIGSYAKCYLFFTSGERLLVVDQHAFHERILYERLLEDQKLLGGSQPLLVPELVPLSAVQIAALKEREDLTKELGFEFKVISDTELEVISLPSLLVKRDPASFLAELADACESSEKERERVLHLVLATIACHSAVRAGEELAADDLDRLIGQSENVDFYHNCPHGRRVLRWFEKSQVERWFDR